MHKGLLCSVSPYFKAALEGAYKEAQEQTIELIEDNAETMEYFQLWLYTQSILDKDDTVSSIEWHILMELYVLGELRLISDLQNQAMDFMIRKAAKTNALPEHKVMYDIFERTCPGSPLRKFIVEASARTSDLPNWKWDFVEGGETAQRDFLKDLVVEIYSDRARKQERNFWKIRCSYHIHREGEPRCPENTPNPDTVLSRS
ncbi:hypothetical protein MMC18_002105 [Xylographa bjoerkii]|nr:hypothetical protein [Xylographa bjoerkii]